MSRWKVFHRHIGWGRGLTSPIQAVSTVRRAEAWRRRVRSIPAPPGEPLHRPSLPLRSATPSQIVEAILYQTEDGNTRLEVKLENNTVWLSQAQIAELFQTTPQNITLHLKSIFAEGELSEAATCKDYLQVRLEGKRSIQRQIRHYNLDAIIAVGCRVKSQRGTQFRIWATQRLSE